jgi:hypothetical protein
MRSVIIRYRVKPDRAEENAALVRAVYDELATTRPEGFRYATFRLEDGVSFVHIAFTEADDDQPLQRIAAFRRFSEGVSERCDEPPVLSEMAEVGSYGLVFGFHGEGGVSARPRKQ